LKSMQSETLHVVPTSNRIDFIWESWFPPAQIVLAISIC